MENKTQTVEDIKKALPCIEQGCAGDGSIAVWVNEEWEQQQCEYCFTVRFPLFDFIDKNYTPNSQIQQSNENYAKGFAKWYDDNKSEWYGQESAISSLEQYKLERTKDNE